MINMKDIYKQKILFAVAVLVLSNALVAKGVEFNDFITTSPIYLLDALDNRASCVNQKLKDSGVNRVVIIDEMPDFSKGTGSSNLRMIYMNTLFTMFKSTGVKILEHRFAQSAHYHYFIRGQLSSEERSLNKGKSVGLLSKYFSFGFNKSNFKTLLQLDFQLLDGGSFLVDVNSMGSLLDSLDSAADGEGAKDKRGLFIDWSNYTGDSLTLAARIMIEQSAFEFASYISGEDFSSCKKLGLRPSVNPNMEEVVVYGTRHKIKPKKQYFPRSYQKTFKCETLENCYFGFRGDNNSSTLLKYVEEAFLASFYDGSTVNVECKPYRREEIKCTASGDLWAFSDKKFKRNLYSE